MTECICGPDTTGEAHGTDTDLRSFAAWLMHRYPYTFTADEFGGDSYVMHEAAAIRRAALRGGFKNPHPEAPNTVVSVPGPALIAALRGESR